MLFPPQPDRDAATRTIPVQPPAFGAVCGAVLVIFLAAAQGWADPVRLLPRLITLPADADAPLFVDIEGNGRAALLVIDPASNTLLNYRQRPDGFANAPDQVIPLPSQTAWVAPFDVDATPGLELLMSTATGLVYSRQTNGLFESGRRTLISASQVFTRSDSPLLTVLSTNTPGTNDLIPVISGGQTVQYHRNRAYEWSPGPPMALVEKHTDWSVNRDLWRDPWALGPNPAQRLIVRQTVQARPEPKRDEKPENEAIRKIIEDMKKAANASPPTIDRVDVDGDGREDLVLWQVVAGLGFKTDLYIFLRGADNKLPERPTQVLHCRGLPIPAGFRHAWSPVHDLGGDGGCELVLIEFKTSALSAGGLLEIALSHGLDWVLTIRSFHRGVFSASPDAAMPLTMILPAEILSGWPICIQGDFNGDGRPDLLVRRTDNQWNIFCSTTDGRWFSPQPAMTFNAPMQGEIETKDLNGGGSSDLIWHETDQRRLSIFMSPPSPAKGKNP